MPTDETRTSLKRLGIAVTSYEDAVLEGASAESVAEASGEARACLKEVTAIVDRLRGTPSMRPTMVHDVMTADPQGLGRIGGGGLGRGPRVSQGGDVHRRPPPRHALDAPDHGPRRDDRRSAGDRAHRGRGPGARPARVSGR